MKPFLQTVEQYFGSYEGTTNREQVHSPIFHFNKVARKKGNRTSSFMFRI